MSKIAFAILTIAAALPAFSQPQPPQLQAKTWKVDGVQRHALVAAPAEGTLRWLAHPGGAVPSAVALTGGQKFLAAVGPEGGLTDAEVALALDHGWQTVSLGGRILRVETAAAALAAWLGISSASTR